MIRLTLVAVLLACVPGVTHAGIVVAGVNGEGITRAEIVSLLVPQELFRLEGEPELDDRDQAVELAIRVRLFAQEAARRGFRSPDTSPTLSRAHLNQALIRDLTETNGLRPADISEEQARDYFESHRTEMLGVASVTVRAIVLRDRAVAARVFEQSRGVTAEQFAAIDLHLTASERAPNSMVFVLSHDHEHDKTAAPMPVVRAGYRLIRTGQVAFVSVGDSHYVLRSEAVEVNPGTWNNAILQRARHLLAYERRQSLLDDLYARLRAEAEISISRSALYEIQGIERAVTN